MIVKDIHVVRAGSEVARAHAAVVMIHGRGASADGMTCTSTLGISSMRRTS